MFEKLKYRIERFLKDERGIVERVEGELSNIITFKNPLVELITKKLEPYDYKIYFIGDNYP